MSAEKEQHGWFRLGMLQSLDWLLLAVPAAFAIRYVPAWKNETRLFIITGIAIIPLAGWMGRATEHLGARAGHGIGGLLNAAFGNAAELIIALMAVSKGLIGVVKASITGSIIGNILLVLGASILAGGMRYPRQTFNQTAARFSATSLSLASVGLIIPTIFHVAADRQPGGWSAQAEQNLSMAIAAVLFLTYILWLVFMLITHKQLFAGHGYGKDASGETNDIAWSVSKAITILALATLLAAFVSEFLVGSVEAARESLGLTEVFVGVIIVAIIGNAAEHSTVVLAALKDKVDLSLGIAIGSSLQIALFVTPVLLFASYLFGRHGEPERDQPSQPRARSTQNRAMKAADSSTTNAPQAGTGWRQIRARGSRLNRQVVLPTPRRSEGQWSAEFVAQETFPAHQVAAKFGQSPGRRAGR